MTAATRSARATPPIAATETDRQPIDAAPTGVWAVFGATGYIGSNLVPYLADRGYRVRATGRYREVLDARPWNDVERVVADALEPGSLDAALAGVDTAFYLVHSMAAGSDFGRLDLEAAANFAAAADRARVSRIVYLGGLMPEGEATGEHLASRRDTGEVLREGPVPVTELRAGIIIGPGSAAFEVMRDLALNLPLMITPRWVRMTSPPIALDNLLAYLEGIALRPEAAGAILDAAGPETVDYTYMMRSLAEQAGKRQPWILPVPVLTPRLSSYWLALVTAVPYPVARALIGGLKHSFTADDAALRELVPQRLLGVDEAIARTLEQEQARRSISRWTEGVFALRGFRHDTAYYSKHATGSAVTDASAADLWAIITDLGGPQRYHYMNWLWLLREIIDWLVGGSGLSRGRRQGQELRVGDVIDYWTVLALEEERLLTLHFDMRAPGSGALEFEILPAPGDRRELRITAHWHPRGVWGLMYWYAMLPAHLFLFGGWSRRLARLARERSS
ncbi:MAG: DUF2867 domain-containing protein [Halieaceae bacterium]|jgi:uncharacterized protein YbjT (DUF2867 family)|nr:DUF2867 domain-containing protein [Halieaceae bacterium]